MGLIRFFLAVGDFAEPDHSALDRAGESRAEHSRYHRRIVLLSAVCGVVGALGVVLAVATATDEKAKQNGGTLLLAPVIFCAVGLLLGVAVACAVAPRRFLEGPLGEKWMKLIGTESVLLARIVCLVLGAVVAAPLVGVAILTALDM